MEIAEVIAYTVCIAVGADCAVAYYEGGQKGEQLARSTVLTAPCEGHSPEKEPMPMTLP
jgi:phage-related minor tail protein